MRKVDMLMIDFLKALATNNAENVVETNMLLIKNISQTQILPSVSVSFAYSHDGLKVQLHFTAVDVTACPVCKTELVDNPQQVCLDCFGRLWNTLG